MSEFLSFFSFVMLLIVVCLILNEKIFKIPPEIALLIFALGIGVVLRFLMTTGIMQSKGIVFETMSTYNIDDVLMNVLLCFMLFSGSSDLKFKSLLNNFKPILLLALLTTVISALVYGGLIYAVVSILGMPIGFDTCVLLGAIISPTDPIAATGILNKLGLSDDITAIMEGESLFNDGTGVALFVFVRGILTHTDEANFFVVMAKELFGAILLGVAVSFICSKVIKHTENEVNHILISLFAVSFCYKISEFIGCSGAIASVVCGIYFTSVMEQYKQKGWIKRDGEIYENFWLTVDKIFNYILYVLIGVSFVYLNGSQHMFIIAISAIVINFIARYVGIYASTIFLRKVPDGYSTMRFTTLMTWSGLKGGLCLALVMSIIDFVPTKTYNILLYIVFITILFTTIIQGLTVAKLYIRLNKTN